MNHITINNTTVTLTDEQVLFIGHGLITLASEFRFDKIGAEDEGKRDEVEDLSRRAKICDDLSYLVLSLRRDELDAKQAQVPPKPKGGWH